jgi:dTDP-glucose 4,6-dehydratase
MDSLGHTVQRCAVLGSNSFAGAAFVAKAIEEGVEVVGFNRSPEGSPIFLPYRRSTNASLYRYIRADLNHDLERIALELEHFRPQAIVDFAGQGMVAESWMNPEQWYTTNVLAKGAPTRAIEDLFLAKKIRSDINTGGLRQQQ